MPIRGRKCCYKSGVDVEFRRIYVDPHNLFPSGGEVNFQRLDKPFGPISGEKRDFGTCDMETTSSLAEPAVSVRGELARAMLYMMDTHKVVIRGMTRAELEDWHKADPPKDWEKKRAQEILARTGLRNPWVD